MGEKRPGHTREESSDHEGGDLVSRGWDAERLRGDLVLADREEGPPMIGAHEVPDQHEGEPRAAEYPREVRALRHAGKASRAPHGVDVQDRDADDLAEPEGHDREIIAP